MRSAKFRNTVLSCLRVVQGGLGVSVMPSHFYFPVPMLKSLRCKDWKACRPCDVLNFRLDEQVTRLQTELLPFAVEPTFDEYAEGEKHEFHFNNGFFEHIDAEITYALVRQRKPSTAIIEIGSGNTTLMMSAALQRNAEEVASRNNESALSPTLHSFVDKTGRSLSQATD